MGNHHTKAGGLIFILMNFGIMFHQVTEAVSILSIGAFVTPLIKESHHFEIRIECTGAGYGHRLGHG
jgi:hypothetical protein